MEHGTLPETDPFQPYAFFSFCRNERNKQRKSREAYVTLDYLFHVCKMTGSRSVETVLIGTAGFLETTALKWESLSNLVIEMLYTNFDLYISLSDFSLK